MIGACGGFQYIAQNVVTTKNPISCPREDIDSPHEDCDELNAEVMKKSSR